MKICELLRACGEYDKSITLGDFIKEIKGNKIHQCPKCKGLGSLIVEYNAYPSGLPDSGWG